MAVTLSFSVYLSHSVLSSPVLSFFSQPSVSSGVSFGSSGASSPESERVTPMPRRRARKEPASARHRRWTVARKRDDVSRSWFPSRCSAEIDVPTAAHSSNTHSVRIRARDARTIRRDHTSQKQHTHIHVHTYVRTHTQRYSADTCDCNNASGSWLCSMFLSAVPHSVAVSPALDCLLYVLVSCFHRERSLLARRFSTSS